MPLEMLLEMLLKTLFENSAFPLVWRPCSLPLSQAILLRLRSRDTESRKQDHMAISPIDSTSSSGLEEANRLVRTVTRR
jgi:hypothetical protein